MLEKYIKDLEQRVDDARILDHILGLLDILTCYDLSDKHVSLIVDLVGGEISKIHDESLKIEILNTMESSLLKEES